MGADYVFDCNSPDCAANIRRGTGHQLRHVFDTVSTGDTAKLCCEAIGAEGGKYTSLAPIEKLPRDNVSNGNTMAFTAVGESFNLGDNHIPAKPEDFAFAVKFTRLAQDLLFEHRFRAHPTSVRRGGLDGVLDVAGLDRQIRLSLWLTSTCVESLEPLYACEAPSYCFWPRYRLVVSISYSVALPPHVDNMPLSLSLSKPGLDHLVGLLLGALDQVLQW